MSGGWGWLGSMATSAWGWADSAATDFMRWMYDDRVFLALVAIYIVLRGILGCLNEIQRKLGSDRQ